jgi:hypothetical protein
LSRARCSPSDDRGIAEQEESLHHDRMQRSGRIRRNELCPCGSGLKYKACCERKVVPPRRSPALLVIGALAALAVIGAIGKAVFDRISTTASSKTNAAETAGSSGLAPLPGVGNVGGRTPQPPGPVPAGKVWSPEHGHWHDAPGVAPLSTGAGTAQPPGPAPKGKVWSAEHGHWHDAPVMDTTGLSVPTVSTAAPPSEPAPPPVSTTPPE